MENGHRAASAARVWRVFGAALLIAPTGCSTVADRMDVLRDTYTVDPVVYNNGELEKRKVTVTGMKLPAEAQVPPAFDLDAGTFPPGGDCKPDDTGRRTAYGQASVDEECRNRLQALLMKRSDDICHAHKAKIVAIAASSNFVLGEITTILAGIGGLVTGETAARVLSGSAAMTNATRSQFNEVFYQNFVTTSIVKAIEGSREEKARAIAAKRGLTKTEYSVDDAIRDASDYHLSCSFFEGLTALSKAAEKIPSSQDELSGRIAALRSEIEKNEKFKMTAGLSNEAKANLTNANEQISKAIESLTHQLTLSKTETK